MKNTCNFYAYYILYIRKKAQGIYPLEIRLSQFIGKNNNLHYKI